jgi:hypothetical protein
MATYWTKRKEGEPAAKLRGHTTKRGQASKAERKNEIMTIEILKIFNS